MAKEKNQVPANVNSLDDYIPYVTCVNGCNTLVDFLQKFNYIGPLL